MEQLGGNIAAQEPLLPGSTEPLLLTYTGITAVDRQLVTLVSFFSPVTDGSSNELSVFALFGLGQLGAVWTLLVMESLRKGNSGRLVSL
jgi:hypothetical protein